jgi:cation transport regulator ChaC
VLYFAYGSNMDSAQMRQSCPGAQLAYASARLDGYEFDFRRRSLRWQAGVADIVKQAHASVFGCLWRLPDDEIPALDKREGVNANPPAYRRLTVTVTAEAKPHTALTYAVVNKSPSPIAPSSDYARLVIQSAHTHALPPDYLASLQARLHHLGVTI